MLSVCIPTYNVFLKDLVGELLVQINRDKLAAEIVIIDDFSEEKYKVENRIYCSNTQYIELPENIGRAKIRNRFLDVAKGEYLLFLDCDSAIIRTDFLKPYCDTISLEKPKVIVGSSIYQTEKPPRNEYLRWKVSVNRESKSLEERKNANFNSFKTNNFVVKKEILQDIPFNETIVGYGHEDTLFGFELAQKNVPILHIDNPVLNKHLDSNPVFLQKTEVGIRNLIHVASIVKEDPDFIQNIKLLQTYHKLKQQKLIGVVGFGISILTPMIKFCLLKGHFTLKMFDVYKLGLLIKFSENK